MRIIRRAREVWQHKPVVEYEKSNPAPATPYTAWEDTRGWKKFYTLVVNQVNDEVAAKNIVIECIIDGETYTSASTAFDNGLIKRCYLNDYGNDILFINTRYPLLFNMELMAENIKVTIELKSAAGTNQKLRVWYSRAELKVV